MGVRVAEPIVLLRVPRHEVPPVTKVRGQWIAASLRAIRERGLTDKYLSKLPPEHHVAIKTTPASQWLLAHVVVAHYAALDALELPAEGIQNIGSSVVIHGHGKAIEVAIKVIPLQVLNVFSVLAHANVLWDRMFEGGAPAVMRLGPKEARVDIVGLPFAHLRYPRIGIRGVLTGIMHLLVKTAYVNDVTAFSMSNTLSFRVSWV